MSNDKPKKYNLKDLLDQCDETAPFHTDPLPGTILDSEWPPYEMTPFAYRVVDWRGTHLAVVQTRERAHAFQKHPNVDPRLNWIYAIYPDESEKLIQGGASIMDDFNANDFEEKWKQSMMSMHIDTKDIEETLSFYQNCDPHENTSLK